MTLTSTVDSIIGKVNTATSHIASSSNPHSVTKTQVGLGNVDNTSDTNKPISTATQTALDLKANQSTTYTKIEVDSAISGLVDSAPLTLNTLNELAAALGDDANFATTVTNNIATKAPLNSPTFTGTVSGVTKTMVGLENVDNTADSAKPVSTAQQTALDLKADLASPTFTGTVSGITATMVGLGSVDNTSDASKPVSTATQTALDLKANLASPTFTGTVAGISKTMVGLGLVDNTSDADKPVSTAQATAIELKQDTLVSGTNIKTVNGSSVLGSGDLTVTSSLPTASTTVLGGVKVGTNLSIDGNGVLSANDTSVGWSEITSIPTTIAGYGITDIGSQSVAYASNSQKINPLSGDANYKLCYTADGQRTNAGEWGRAVMRYEPNGQTYGIRVDRADYADSAGNGTSSASFGGAGYQRFNNGFIIQWGERGGSGAGNYSIYYPIAFPNATLQVVAVQIGYAPTYQNINVNGFTNSYVNIGQQSSFQGTRYIAIGY